MFKEKVGEIFVDLSMNLSKTSRAKALQSVDAFGSKVGNSLSVHARQWGSKLKSGFFSRMGAFLAVGTAVAAVNTYNNSLKETVNYFDDLQTKADSLRISFEQIQELNMVAQLGDIDADRLTRAVVKLKGFMGDLAIGKKNEQTEFLKQMGLTGNENEMEALKIVLTSLKRTGDSGNNAAVDAFLNSGVLGRIDATSKQFWTTAGLEKIKKVLKILEDPNKKKNYILTDKDSGKIGTIDDDLKLQKVEHLVKIGKNIDLKSALDYNQKLLNIQDVIAVNTGHAVTLLSAILNTFNGNPSPSKHGYHFVPGTGYPVPDRSNNKTSKRG